MSGEESGARAARQRAVLVSSPHAGNAVSAEKLAEHLGRAGITVATSLLVSDLDHSRPQGTIWRDQGHDLVIAAGGDGTIGALATQLAGSDVPLAILPLGTANDVARSLYLPMDIEAACGVIASAVPIDMDAGQVLPGLTEPGAYSAAHESARVAGAPSPVAGVAFLHAVTLGLNVEFARLATDSLRRQRLGNLTYAASALEAVTRYHPVDVALHIFGQGGADADDETAETVIESRVVQVAVFNTPVFGGRLGMRVPAVSVHDRQLDFMIIEALDAQRLRQTVEHLLAMLRARAEQPEGQAGVAPHEQHVEALRVPGVRHFRAKAAIIEASQDLDVTLDGEIRTHTPVLVRVAPHQLRVLVSPAARHRLMGDATPADSDIPDAAPHRNHRK